MQSLNETMRHDVRGERVAKLSVPPNARLVSYELLPEDKVRVVYRYAGAPRPNSITVRL